MKCLSSYAVKAAVVVQFTLGAYLCFGEVRSTQVLVKAVQGEVTFSTSDTKWTPVQAQTSVERGTTIKTGDNATADLILQASGTVLRLTPNTTLRLARLDKEAAGEDVITETGLQLLAGSVVGSQRKLVAPSRFEFTLPGGVVTIVGTEYLVRADGAVTVLSGQVTVNFNLPGNGGDVRVTVPAGYSFNPATGQVVPTTAAFLQNIIADVDTVRNNAQVFKAGGATVVVKPEAVVSPTKGNNGVGNGIDPQPPGNPPINDGPGTSPGNPGNKKGGANKFIRRK